MKKRLEFLFCMCFLIPLISANAQFTKGGTYKNYEKYHITYDTIKTVRTITTPGEGMGKAGYFFVNVGPAIPFGIFAQKPTAGTYIEADYLGLGGLGGTTGFDVGIGGFEGIRGINKHLIRQIDLAVYNAASFTYLPWSYGTLAPSDETYDAFMALNLGIGPAVIFNPIEKVDFHIDLAYRIGLGVTFGGAMTTSSGFYDISRQDVGFGFFHGPLLNIRYSFLLVGFELNLLRDYGSFSFYDGVNTSYFQGSVPLNNFAIKIGVAF